MDRLRHIKKTGMLDGATAALAGVAAFACLLAGPAGADGAPQTLTADPPAAHLAITGPVALSGAAPLPIGELPDGEYELRADGYGLPLVRGRFVREGDGLQRRPWAGISTILLPPGMLHLQRGERRGWSFLGAAAVGAFMAIDSQTSLWDAEDDRDRAIRDYERAVSEAQIRSTRYRVEQARDAVDDHAEMRTLWLGYLGTSWLGAAAEALLLTPQPTLRSGAAGEYVAGLPRLSGAGLALR
ncbi:MAG: hypothetical protein GF330_05950, partial [Candidatus Eisenbacteria bacterium]|nr:hypothetical protein [Candidatus Eisenbacteria bacterium]